MHDSDAVKVQSRRFASASFSEALVTLRFARCFLSRATQNAHADIAVFLDIFFSLICTRASF